MNLTLGALSTGSLFQHGVKLWLSRLPVLFLIHLILLLPNLAGQLLYPAVAYRAGAGLGTLISLGLFLAFVQMVFLALGLAASLYVVTQALVGRPATLNDALTFGLSRFATLLPAAALLGGIVNGPLLIGSLPGLLLLSPDGWVGIILLVLGLLAGLAASLYLFSGFLLVPQVVMAERADAMAALSRSLALTSGRRLNTVIVLVLMGLVFVILGIVAYPINLVLPYARNVSASTFTPALEFTSYFNYLVNILVGYLLNCLGHSLTSVVWTLFYFDSRARQEPLDLAQIAQQQM